MHTTEPHALQEVLRQISDPQSGQTMNQRWATALGEKPGTPTFAALHTEVIGLLSESVRLIQTLPENKQRNYMSSAPHWWAAVISPEAMWRSKTEKVIGEEHINLLGGLGDLIEERFKRTPASPGGFGLEDVRTQCEEWLDGLDGLGLPERFRDLLRDDLQHLIWLIENVDKFGHARIARAAEAITGQLASTNPEVPDEHRPAWQARVKKWARVVIVFTGLVASDMAVEAASEAVQQLTISSDEVGEIVRGEIEPPDDAG